MPFDFSLFLEREITEDTTSSQQQQPRELRNIPLLGHGCFIRGARRSGKTSFAFQAAVNTALEGRRVAVMCCEHVLCSKLPQPFAPLCTLDRTALARIEFVYIESITEVVRELGAWRTPDDVPALVIVDDDGFTDAGDARRTAQLLAALENVYEWITRNTGSVVVHTMEADKTEVKSLKLEWDNGLVLRTE